MNRERLRILRDHLAGLPDELFDMMEPCGTICCIGGWANNLFVEDGFPTLDRAERALELDAWQASALFYASNIDANLSDLTRLDAISAIDSMLANPDDGALPVWPQPNPPVSS